MVCQGQGAQPHLGRRLGSPCCSKVLAAAGKEVKGFFGGSHSHSALGQTTGVIVCTIEKANIM